MRRKPLSPSSGQLLTTSIEFVHALAYWSILASPVLFHCHQRHPTQLPLIQPE